MITKFFRWIFPLLAMLILILDSKTALTGGLEGLQVCLMTVVPSLFPFFVLSVLLTAGLGSKSFPFLKPLGRLCRMSPGSEPLLLLGLLGGYPAGAQAVALRYSSGHLTAIQARRLLGFCSNAGPAFLFGMAALAFPDPLTPWILWLIHILSALLTGIFLPGGSREPVRPSGQTHLTLSQAVERAVQTLTRVCAWILLFRIILAFCRRWFLWLLPVELQVIFTGLLELANGCLSLGQLPDPQLRFVICSGLLALGGLSVTMQTLSVTGHLGLGLYLPGKLLQCAFSVGLSLLWLNPAIAPYALIPAVFWIFIRKLKNNSGNSRKAIV